MFLLVGTCWWDGPGDLGTEEALHIAHEGDTYPPPSLPLPSPPHLGDPDVVQWMAAPLVTGVFGLGPHYFSFDAIYHRVFG